MGALFLEKTLASIVQQREDGIDLELIVVDGGSTDSSPTIIKRFQSEIDVLIVEEDTGPAQAINKGFALAKGDIVSWLNADDLYFPGALKRIQKAMHASSSASFCFGRCLIIDEKESEIRRGITRFKELFFPVSSKLTFQTINYISQPALFFRKSALDAVGFLREDMVAAWDYEFLMRLWVHGQGRVVNGSPLAAFRWHEHSISGRKFHLQFQEELAVARRAAGEWAPQVLLHHLVRLGVVSAYSLMAMMRYLSAKCRKGLSSR
jgi:glycosyltransferase involved in cell wall biosynthesis